MLEIGSSYNLIKRCLLLGRKATTNLDSTLKSRIITLPTKVHRVKAMDFPVVLYRCESWTIKKAECQGIQAFELWCCRRLFFFFSCIWDVFEFLGQQGDQISPILQEINPEYSWEGEWCWSSNTLATWCEEPTHWKRPWCWERWRAKEEGGSRGWDE